MKRLFMIAIIVGVTCTATAQMLLDNGVFSSSDQYLQGYINALLVEKFQTKAGAEVKKGEVFLDESITAHPQYEDIIVTISKIDSVKAIKLVSGDRMKRLSRTWVFADDPLFQPIIADPRWPHFSAEYRLHADEINYSNSVNIALGKNIPIYRSGMGESTAYEVGVQLGVFTGYHTGMFRFDMINTDYLIAIPITLQYDVATFMVRGSYMHSQLGDEFKANKNINTIRHNRKDIEFIASYEPNSSFRGYVGVGGTLDSEPSGISGLKYQIGVEGSVVPDIKYMPPLILALDLQGHHVTDYKPNASVLVGVGVGNRSMVAASLYTGYSPDGQFYTERTTSLGIGFYVY